MEKQTTDQQAADKKILEEVEARFESLAPLYKDKDTMAEVLKKVAENNRKREQYK